MEYLGKNTTGRAATRARFIRSMDLEHAPDADAALKNYQKYWFSSTRRGYLTQALKQIRRNSLFWSPKAFFDMLEEITLSLCAGGEMDRSLLRDIDTLRACMKQWTVSRSGADFETLRERTRIFEKEHRFPCPETFQNCWMNTGAAVTLAWEIRWDGFTFCPDGDQKKSLDRLAGMTMEAAASMDHDLDTRLFRLAYEAAVRSPALQPEEKKKIPVPVPAEN